MLADSRWKRPCSSRFISMEASGTAHFWGRRIAAHGHEVRLIHLFDHKCADAMLDQAAQCERNTVRGMDDGGMSASVLINTGICWLAFLDTYRTMCRTPDPEFQVLLERVRRVEMVAVRSF